MPSSSEQKTAAAAVEEATPDQLSPRMSSKALALIVASKTNKNVATETKRRVSAKTGKKKSDDVPALAGNFQDRDEIEIKVSCQDITSNTNIKVPETGGKGKGNDKGISTFCVIYSTSSDNSTLVRKDAGTGTGEGRDETESLAERSKNGRPARLPIGCTELGRRTSAMCSFETEVLSTFSIYKMKDIVVALYQQLRKDSSETSQQNLLGCVSFSLHKLVCANEAMDSTLEKGGRITVLAAPTDSRRKNLRFRFTGKGLGVSKSLGVKPVLFDQNPFLAVSYLREESVDNEKEKMSEKATNKKGKWEVLWKSDVVRGSTNPCFNFGQIPTYNLRGGTPMCVTCLNYDDKGKRHTIIGQAKTTYHELLRSACITLRHNKKTTGYIAIEHMDMTMVPSLSHYLSKRGLELDLMVAVDFTENNMQVDESDYQDPRSFLHRLRRSGKMNGYQLALSSVGTIFEELNSMKAWHIWGFGAEVNGIVRHRLRMGSEGGRVKGVEGLLHAYNETATSNIILSGPKDLRKTIYTAIARAEMNASTTLSYSVLLVLCCEGFVYDRYETYEQICEASYTPLSIVFVGIGGGNFSDFQEMAEEQKVSPSGKKFMRECVSFVQFEQYRHDINKFLKVALQDLPKQTVQYHMSKQISPDRDALPSDHDGDDDDLCNAGHPHLLAEAECVDMTEVSAYVSPGSSLDNTSTDEDEFCEEHPPGAYCYPGSGVNSTYV